MSVMLKFSTLLIWLTLSASSATAQTVADTVPLAKRIWIASKLYASVQLYFAHWQGVPGLDLDDAYRFYITRAVASSDRREFDLASLEFMARLRNGHSSFSDAWLWDTHGQPLGFRLKRLGDDWVVTESRIGALAPGDVVLAIADQPIADFAAERLRYISASSDRAREDRLFNRPFLFPDTFTLTLKGGRQVRIQRSMQRLAPASSRKLEERDLENGIAYLYIPSFANRRFEEGAIEFLRRRDDVRAIIIDVRGNGGGTTPVELIAALMDRAYQEWIESTSMSIGLFGAYGRVAEIAGPDDLTDYVRGYVDAFAGFDRPLLLTPGNINQPGKPIYTGPLFILADGHCASACENFLLPFKVTARARIIGEATRGSTGQPYLYEFGNGMSFRVSSKRVFFPDGSTFEGIGILPDVPVQRTVEDIRTERDVVLRRALELAMSSGDAGN